MVYDRRIITPWLKDGIGGNCGIKYPFCYAHIIYIIGCGCCTTGSVNPPGAQLAVAVQDTAVVFKTCQVLLLGRP